MKKSNFFKVSASLLLINIPLASYADHCDSKIINNLTKPVTVSFSTTRGDVHFKDSSCPENGPCTINPNDSVGIVYTRTDSDIDGTVDADDIGSLPYTNFSGQGVLEECPHSNDSNSVNGAISMGHHGEIVLN